jgi:hypothetical protein
MLTNLIYELLKIVFQRITKNVEYCRIGWYDSANIQALKYYKNGSLYEDKINGRFNM